MIVSSQLLCHIKWLLTTSRSSHPEVFLVKVVRKIRSKFTGERPCRSVSSIKLLYNFIEITLWYWCSSVNLLHIFRTPFSKNTSGWLPLNFCNVSFYIISSDIYWEQLFNFWLLKYNMEKLDDLWFTCFSNEKSKVKIPSKVLSVRKPSI